MPGPSLKYSRSWSGSGRQRIHSASSQLPAGSTSLCPIQCPGPSVTRLAQYLSYLLIIAIVLSLNNLVLMYWHRGSSNPKGPVVYHDTSKHPDYTHPKMMQRKTQAIKQAENTDKPQTYDSTNVFKSDKKKVISVTKPTGKLTQSPAKGERVPTKGVQSPAKSEGAPAGTVSEPREYIWEELPKSVTPNEVLQKAALVIINIHTECQLNKIVKSFQRDYPDIPVHMQQTEITAGICNSEKTNKKKIKCLDMPAPCQRNAGCVYNRLVDSTESTYILVWDARYVYNEQHSVAMLAKVYVETRVKIISPCDTVYCGSITGALHIPSSGRRQLTALPGVFPPSPITRYYTKCFQSAMFPPIYLASRQTLRHQQWDAHMSAGHHTDFILNVNKQSLGILICKDILVSYTSTCEETKSVKPFNLEEEWLSMSADSFHKWNITDVYNGLGKTVSLTSDDKISVSTNKWRSVESMPRSQKSFDHKLKADVINKINDQRPGWEAIREYSSGDHNLSYIYSSPCMIHVKGQLHVEYDRHISFPNKNGKMEVDHHLLNRSCEMFRDYWRMTSFGKTRRKPVYYVTVLSNDESYMERLLQNLNSQYDKANTHLVIVDMGRVGEQFNHTKYHLRIHVEYIYLGAPFSRSIGLRKGFDYVVQISTERGDKNPIIFAIDNSMIIPTDFTRRIMHNTRCRISAYSPICMRHRDDGSYWNQFGYGMVGVCALDYSAAKGWNPTWGYHVGAEDVDFIARLQKELPYIVRIRESNYNHSHSEDHRINNLYYKERNVYQGKLPVIPTTRIVTDDFLKNSLASYAVRLMKYPILLTLDTIYATSAPQSLGIIYDIRFKNTNNEEYYALIESI